MPTPLSPRQIIVTPIRFGWVPRGFSHPPRSRGNFYLLSLLPHTLERDTCKINCVSDLPYFLNEACFRRRGDEGDESRLYYTPQLLRSCCAGWQSQPLPGNFNKRDRMLKLPRVERILCQGPALLGREANPKGLWSLMPQPKKYHVLSAPSAPGSWRKQA